MKIEMTYDLVCPWCYLALGRLARAVRNSGRDDLEIVLWPFQLAPEVPTAGVDHFAFFVARVGESNVRRIYAMMEEVARQEDMSIRYDAISRMPNTYLAHQLVLFAALQGAGMQMASVLMSAHFAQGLDIGEQPVLLRLAAQFEYGVAALQRYWDSDQARASMIASRGRAASLGIHGVPHFVIAGNVHAGAVSEEQLRAAL